MTQTEGLRATHKIAEKPPRQQWTPSCRPKGGPNSSLSATKLSQTQRRQTRWGRDAAIRLMPHPSRRWRGSRLSTRVRCSCGTAHQLRQPGSSFHPHQFLPCEGAEGAGPSATVDSGKRTRPTQTGDFNDCKAIKLRRGAAHRESGRAEPLDALTRQAEDAQAANQVNGEARKKLVEAQELRARFATYVDEEAPCYHSPGRLRDAHASVLRQDSSAGVSRIHSEGCVYYHPSTTRGTPPPPPRPRNGRQNANSETPRNSSKPSGLSVRAMVGTAPRPKSSSFER